MRRAVPERLLAVDLRTYGDRTAFLELHAVARPLVDLGYTVQWIDRDASPVHTYRFQRGVITPGRPLLLDLPEGMALDEVMEAFATVDVVARTRNGEEVAAAWIVDLTAYVLDQRQAGVLEGEPRVGDDSGGPAWTRELIDQATRQASATHELARASSRIARALHLPPDEQMLRGGRMPEPVGLAEVLQLNMRRAGDSLNWIGEVIAARQAGPAKLTARGRVKVAYRALVKGTRW